MRAERAARWQLISPSHAESASERNTKSHVVGGASPYSKEKTSLLIIFSYSTPSRINRYNLRKGNKFGVGYTEAEIVDLDLQPINPPLGIFVQSLLKLDRNP